MANEDDGMLLDLDTLAPQRQTVFIRSSVHQEGRHYGVRSVEEMSLVDQQKLYQYTNQADELLKKDVTHEQAVLLTSLLDDIARAVLIGIEDQVLSEMTDWQKAQIAQAFINASRLNSQTSLEAEETAEDRLTGES